MKFIALVLRYWGCVFCGLLGLFLTALALLIVGTHIQNLDMAMLPWWKGPTLIVWLFVFGIGGIASGALALFGKFKPLLVLYSLAAAAIIVYGYFINLGYHFDGQAGAYTAAWFALGALLAFVGSLAQFSPARRA